ncbi:helix-turn-helix domain-containing protein [Neptuniibacter sp.]|uniref:helix-turn-helix domain-containing protein n=1 Tax=Neptuniibacter sp. TaxID=1962643 RepID=UPI00261F7B3F|nr:helix-turn-helix domain-containing protein [Neptuniibacter sp.]MCP4597771.1 hypothetical protein [Neptuniibacter sp.]
MASVLEPHKSFIAAELLRGRSYSSLGKELGVHGDTVRQFAVNRGLTVSRKADLESMKEEIIQLYNQDLSADSVALVLGLDRSGVYAALRRWGQIRKKESLAPLPKVSLNDLKNDWIEVKEPHVVTVGRIGRFYLLPITGQEGAA